MRKILLTVGLAAALLLAPQANARGIIHDAEYSILEAQNGEAWVADDRAIEDKLAEIRRSNSDKSPSLRLFL